MRQAARKVAPGRVTRFTAEDESYAAEQYQRISGRYWRDLSQSEAERWALHFRWFRQYEHDCVSAREKLRRVEQSLAVLCRELKQ